MAEPAGHDLQVHRTARYFELGATGPEVEDAWMVLHGYGQLADLMLRHFQPLVTPRRLFVAPEGLSRFYLDQPTTLHRFDRIGASWLTRRERESEIEDNVRYLDAVAGRMAERAPRARLLLLGFSQGAATAARWVLRRPGRASGLVLWGVLPTPDLMADPRGLAATRLTLVRGREDEYVGDAEFERDVHRLRMEVPDLRVVSFRGGHRLDPKCLAQVVDQPLAGG